MRKGREEGKRERKRGKGGGRERNRFVVPLDCRFIG